MAGFKVNDNKGFHVTFENGNTVSVQFGRGNYCSNYDTPRDMLVQDGVVESHDAECTAWGSDGAWHKLGDNDDVIGWQHPADVLALLNRMAGNPHAALASEMVEALRDLLRVVDERTARGGWADHGERARAHQLIAKIGGAA